MNEQQRLFFVQAAADYELFQSLRKVGKYRCHALHYLQMATEKLSKAYFWKAGFPGKGHAMFRRFSRTITTNKKVRIALNYGNTSVWEQKVKGIAPIVLDVERLAPTEQLAGDGPNPEYPWPPKMPTTAPVEFGFTLWEALHKSTGRQLLKLLDQLFAKAEHCF